MNDKNPLHIAFGVDEHYIRPMGITMQSILAHNPEKSLIFHVFCSQPSNKEIHNLKLMEKQSGCGINIYEPIKLMDIDLLKTTGSPAHISKATFHRLFIPQALNEAERVLYLDADILCTGSLEGLPWDSVAPVYAVKEKMAASLKNKLADITDIKLTEYFNAGVLWINIPSWRENKITEQALNMLVHPSIRLPYFDQDALNIVLKDSIKFLDEQWNHQYGLNRALNRQETDLYIPKETKLVHFVGPMKPWRSWNPHASKNIFLNYQNQTPWANYSLDENLNFREERIYTRFQYRQCIKKLCWIEALRWYLKFRKLPKKIHSN